MLRQEILQCLVSSRRCDDGAAVFLFRFPATLTAFRGHFPGEPVLPGVCSIQAALLATEADRGQRLRLAAIRSAKFLAFVPPDGEVEFLCRFLPAERATALLTSTVRCGERRIAELALQVAILGERP